MPRGKIKVYNLVGSPTEKPGDWAEFMEDLRAVDLERWRSEKGTPPRKIAAGTPDELPQLPRPGLEDSNRDTWRLETSCRYLRAEEHVGQLFYQGRNLWAVESLGTESLATHILDALALRGVESDAEAVARFACSRRFWTASVARRVAMLERYLDVARLFRGYTWRDLPTRYLRSYTAPEKIKHADEAARRRTGGVAWGLAVIPASQRQ